MFVGSRERAVAVVEQSVSEVCVYSRPGNVSRTCDCKYGVPIGPGTKPLREPRGGEKTGCPELRSALAVLRAMTDAEWNELSARGGNVRL